MYNTRKINSFWHDSKWIIRFLSYHIRYYGSGLSYIKSIIELTQDNRVTHYFRNRKNGIFNSFGHIGRLIIDTEQCYSETALFKGSLSKDYINVVNGCWRRIVLVTTLRCWWRFGHFGHQHPLSLYISVHS